MKAIVATCFVVLTMLNTIAQTKGPSFGPDLVIVNASIHTMDTARPTAEAVAISGNRIAAVGGTAEIRALAGRGTRVIDAGGKLVSARASTTPTCISSWAASRWRTWICATRSRRRKWPGGWASTRRSCPKGRWILGGDWDHESGPARPCRREEMIDAATPDHPVWVNRLDGHMALANSLALKLAGVTKETKDPPGGVIVRDAKTGEPTGILKDAAEDLVERVVPEKSL